MIANNGTGFDSYVAINNLPQWRSVVNLIKNGAGIVSLKFFNGYVDPAQKIPSYIHSTCGRVQIDNSLKKNVSFTFFFNRVYNRVYYLKKN